MYQAVLSDVYIFLIGVNTPYLDYSVPIVFFWLFLFSFLRGLLFCLVFWENGSNLFVFRLYDLGSFSVSQKGSILS